MRSHLLTASLGTKHNFGEMLKSTTTTGACVMWTLNRSRESLRTEVLAWLDTISELRSAWFLVNVIYKKSLNLLRSAPAPVFISKYFLICFVLKLKQNGHAKLNLHDFGECFNTVLVYWSLKFNSQRQRNTSFKKRKASKARNESWCYLRHEPKDLKLNSLQQETMLFFLTVQLVVCLAARLSFITDQSTIIRC